jgi:hypothetical protein
MGEKPAQPPKKKAGIFDFLVPKKPAGPQFTNEPYPENPNVRIGKEVDGLGETLGGLGRALKGQPEIVRTCYEGKPIDSRTNRCPDNHVAGFTPQR